MKTARMRYWRIALVVMGMLIILPGSAVSDQAGAADPAACCENVTQIIKIWCEALVALYSSTDGDHWANKAGWVSTRTPCSWHGVDCSASHAKTPL